MRQEAEISQKKKIFLEKKLQTICSGAADLGFLRVGADFFRSGKLIFRALKALKRPQRPSFGVSSMHIVRKDRGGGGGCHTWMTIRYKS